MVFAVMGGDERQSRLASQLARDGHEVRVFALEVAVLPNQIEHSEGAAEATRGADCVILPLPVSVKRGYLNAPLSTEAHCLGEVFGSLSPGTPVCAGMPDADTRSLARSSSAELYDYYAARRVVLLDKNLDCAAMAAKGATFLTRTAVLAESLLTAALPMFGDDVNVEVVPDGCAYVGDDAELSDALLRRHGDKLYVSGDLMVPPRAAPLLARLSFLHVTGDVLLPESAMDAFVALGAQCGGELIAVRGVLLSGRPELKLRRASLEDAPEGLTVHACAEVHLDEDITPELIGERLTLLSCAEVHCTRAQRPAVERVARDVAEITEEDTVSFSGDFGDDDVNGAYHFCVGDPKNNKVINAASYAL